MNEIEKQLLRDECGDVEPRLSLCTKTRIDTGRWWHPTRAWLCVTADELVALSVSRRRYLERVPLDACRESRYCHASGELVVEPVEGMQHNRFAVSPRDALSILSHLNANTE